MLTIFIKREGLVLPKELITDIEKEFSKLRILGTETDKKLIEQIEHGKYNDSNSYVDRFGYKLHFDDMSTGCKAALCVANIPDKIMSLSECGQNARSIIIHTCKTGNILMEDKGLTISTEHGTDTNVKIANKYFSNIDELNKFISDGKYL